MENNKQNKTDLEELIGIFKKYDGETILSALEKLGVQGFFPGQLFKAAGRASKKSADCGPDNAKATKWDDWNRDEGSAETNAYKKARDAAGRACHGACTSSEKCKYTEASSELLETETQQDESGHTEYRCRVKSEGSCACE